MDEPAPPTRIEQFNQAVRAVVLLALTGGFIYGFIVSKVVSTESFAIVFGIALTWWFKSRDEEKKMNGKPHTPPVPPAP